MTNLDLQKYVVRKASKNHTTKRGLSIKSLPSGGIVFNYYSEIFKKFRYIVFYVVDDTLIMELTNETKENAYALTQRGTSIRTHISGMAGEQMNRFCGEYRDVKFYNKTKSNPLLYVTMT